MDMKMWLISKFIEILRTVTSKQLFTILFEIVENTVGIENALS